MPYYCHLHSTGSIAHTNLQLYSLREAASHWNTLLDNIRKRGVEGMDDLKERQVFILHCLGLSLSQLLDQNSPSPEKEKMDDPGDLLHKILVQSHADRTTRQRLNRTFQEFLAYYGSVRHFGKNKDEKNYRTIEKLTIQELDRFRRMTIEIWDTVIAMYRQDDQNDFGRMRSICEVVWFDYPAAKSNGTFVLT
jgi:hypothetical protein